MTRTQRPSAWFDPPVSPTRTLRALCAMLLIGLAGLAQAQWPDKPIRMVLGVAPGGGTDLMARTYAQPLGEKLGQPIVIANNAGASGNIAVADVVNAVPDGYTLLMGPLTYQTANPFLIKNTPNMVRDLVPVALVGKTQLFLLTKRELAVESVADLVRLAKEKPGSLSYSSSGVGTSPHFLGELFAKEAGITVLHVPFRSAGPALMSVVQGEADIGFFSGSALPQVRAGKVRVLAVASEKRSAEVPNPPTLRELGIRNVEYDVWYGVWAPAKTPKAVVDRLTAALLDACQGGPLRAKFSEANIDPDCRGPADMQRVLADETKVLSTLIRERNIVAE